MADNIAVSAGSGTTVATDDIGGVHYQRVKLALGADGTANDASVGAGAVGTGTQRITLASDDPAVVALQLLDNAISGSEMQVDIITSALPDGAMTEATGQAIIAAIEAPVTELPQTPLLTTSDLTSVHVTRSTSGETSAVSATASQTTRVHMVTILVAGAVTVELLDGSAGTSLRKWVFPDKGGFFSGFVERPLAKTTANTALYVKTSAAVAVDVTLDYEKSA